MRHCQASGGDTRADDYGREDGDGGACKGDSDLHADHGGEDVGDCGGKRDGGDGGDKHQITCSSYRHLAMILWPGYYDTEVTIYLDSQYSQFIEGSDAKLGSFTINRLILRCRSNMITTVQRNAQSQRSQY